MLRILFHGNFKPGSVHLRWSQSSRLIVPEVGKLIDESWQRAQQRPGIRLFDGPMCRLESWNLRDDQLHLELSQTSYKPFFGTNLSHPELSDRYGKKVLANPVGVSPALITADNRLMFGRRNSSLAYYPDRIHPFAGSLEPRDDLDVFAAVRRELEEEVALRDDDIVDVACTGLVEDLQLRQPELIFSVRTRLSIAEIEQQVDVEEHRGTWSCEASSETIADTLAKKTELTPVARAAMLLWGRIEFGQRWFVDVLNRLGISAF